METEVAKLYEAMFLVDSAQAAADWDGVNETITKILKKADAEIVLTRKWDERRLAYEVKGKERGTYIICYFKADGEKIRDIERDVQLTERIMRVLILSAEHIKEEDVGKDIHGKQSEQEAAKEVTVGADEEQLAVESETEEVKEPEAVAVEKGESEQEKKEDVGKEVPGKQSEEVEQEAAKEVTVGAVEEQPAAETETEEKKEPEAVVVVEGESEQEKKEDIKSRLAGEEPGREDGEPEGGKEAGEQ